MTIGDRARLVPTVATLELVTLLGGHLEIGNNLLCLSIRNGPL
jgi:hypothetical protein